MNWKHGERALAVVRWLLILLAAALLAVGSPANRSGSPDTSQWMILGGATALYALAAAALAFTSPPHPGLSTFFWLCDLTAVSFLCLWTGSGASPFLPFFFILAAARSLIPSIGAAIGYGVLAAAAAAAVILLGTPLKHPAEMVLETAGGLMIISAAAGSALQALAGGASASTGGQQTTSRDADRMLTDAYEQTRQQVAQRERQEVSLADKTRKLGSLMEIARMLTSTHRLRDLVGVLVTKAREEANAGMAVLLLRRGQQLVMAGSDGAGVHTKEIFEAQVGQGTVGRVAQQGQPLRLSEADQNADMSFFAGASERIHNVLLVPLVAPQDKEPLGVLGVANILVGDRFDEEHQNYLQILAVDAAIAIKNIYVIEQLEQSYNEMIFAFSQAVEARDKYTSGHIVRVSEYSVKLAKFMGLPPDEVELIRKGAVLHDVGKLGTPDRVLLKQSALDEEERILMNQHVVHTAEILGSIKSLDQRIVMYAANHHERYDGQGYPKGLKGDEIPLGAAIISVADSFDAMVTDRPYRKAMSFEVAVSKLEPCAGTQFNPKAMEAFARLIRGEIAQQQAPAPDPSK